MGQLFLLIPISLAICFMLFNPGHCESHRVVWSFSGDDEECIRVLYSGCGGNRNRFNTKAQCEHFCELQ